MSTDSVSKRGAIPECAAAPLSLVPSPLLPHHQARIDASAISPEVAAQRGYRSVTTKAELRRLGFSAAQCSTPTLLIPIWNVHGEIVLYHHRPDAARVVDGKAHKYEFPAGGRMALDVPPAARSHIGDPRVPLFITEGVRKADAAVSIGLCCIAVIGTWNWRGTNGEGGKTALPDWEAITLKAKGDVARAVYLVFDSDAMYKQQVHDALDRLARFLRARGAHTRFIYLPHGAHGEKVGLDDYLAAGHDREDLLSLAADELRPLPATDTEQPRIPVAGRRMHEIAGDVLAALARANAAQPFLFSRGNTAVRLVGDGAALAAAPLTLHALKGEIDRRAAFVNANGVYVRPPADVVQDILALASPPFPPLEGIVSAPVFLPSGALLVRNGYDAGSGFYVNLSRLDGVRADMPPAEALALLRDELFGDFPFGDESSLAHALALLLLPFARPLIQGPTPLHLLDAPTPRTGKGLMADVVAIVAQGASAPVLAYTRDDEEMQKRVTAALLAGNALILLDNIPQTVRLDAASLMAALTAETWSGRILGKSEVVPLPQRAVWMVSGNNVAVSDEAAGRAVLIRLDAVTDRPGERTEFRHELPRWAYENRPALVSACLSLIQQWLDAGRPAGTAALGRFESWARVLGGILGLAGVEGFLTNRETLYTQADSEGEEWRTFCLAAYNRFQGQPTAAGALVALLRDAELFPALWLGKNELAATQRLGRALHQRRDRVFGTYRIRLAGRDGTTRRQLFAVVPVDRTTKPSKPSNPSIAHDFTPEPLAETQKVVTVGSGARPSGSRAKPSALPRLEDAESNVSKVSKVGEPPSAAYRRNGASAPVAVGDVETF